jgi:hypothetical protein
MNEEDRTLDEYLATLTPERVAEFWKWEDEIAWLEEQEAAHDLEAMARDDRRRAQLREETCTWSYPIS